MAELQTVIDLFSPGICKCGPLAAILQLSEQKSDWNFGKGDAKSLLLLFASFSLRHPSRGNNDELRQMKIFAKSFHEFEGMLMNNAYQSNFVNFPLVLHIPSLGPKAERQHHSSLYVAKISHYL